MPFNGSGTFSRLYSWAVDAANSVDISSSRTDAEMNGFAAGLSNCLTRDGQSPPSADLPMGGKKLTNLGNALSDTDALNRITGDGRYVLASGATNLTLAGALNAATGAFSGNVTIGGTLGVTGLATLSDGALSNGFLNASSGAFPVSYSANRTGQAGYHIYNGGGVVEWGIIQPAHATDDDFHLVSVVSGVTTDRLKVSAGTGAVSIPGALAVSGAVTCPTPSPGDSSTKAATTAFVAASFAPLASPTLTGTPTAPTAAVGTNTAQLATTAFVAAAKAPNIQSVTSAATVTPTFSNDLVDITAQAVGLTLVNPTGTAVNGWGIVIRIKDNGTPQTIAYGTQYTAIGVAKPTTTVAGKVLMLGIIFNNNLTRWEIVSAAEE